MKIDRQAIMRPLFLESVQPKPDEIWFSVEPSIDDFIICRWIGVDIDYTLQGETAPRSRFALKQSAVKLLITLAESNKEVPIAVDIIEVGVGVYQHLLDEGYSVVAVNPANHRK